MNERENGPQKYLDRKKQLFQPDLYADDLYSKANHMAEVHNRAEYSLSLSLTGFVDFPVKVDGTMETVRIDEQSLETLEGILLQTLKELCKYDKQSTLYILNTYFPDEEES